MVSQVKKKLSDKSLAIIKPGKTLDQFRDQRKAFRSLVKADMREGTDYGLIPGTRQKSLWQPGAEKLANFFGLTFNLKLIKEIERLKVSPTISSKFVYYKYECTLSHFETGKFVGKAERSCNSKETAKMNTRKSVYDLINTCQAVAQKRAFVAAVRTATMASDFFSSDISNGATGSTTKEADPIRTGQMAKLHAVATPRGFNEERLHKVILVRYKKRSRTELTGSEIAELTEDLLEKFKEVGAGNKPERYEPKEEATVTLKGEEAEVIKKKVEEAETKEFKKKKIDDLKKTIKKIENKPGKCYQCGKALTKEMLKKSKYYCSDECKEKYYPSKKKIDFKAKAKIFNKGKGVGRKKLDLVKLECGIKVWVDWNSEEQCKCGETIWWGTTDKNKKSMPINVVAPGKWDTHFATCKLAKEKRKKK